MQQPSPYKTPGKFSDSALDVGSKINIRGEKSLFNTTQLSPADRDLMRSAEDPLKQATRVYHVDNPVLSKQVEQLIATVSDLQSKLQANEHKVNSFETFLNYSNPLGQAYTLKPGKSLIYLPISYSGLNCPADL